MTSAIYRFHMKIKFSLNYNLVLSKRVFLLSLIVKRTQEKVVTKKNGKNLKNIDKKSTKKKKIETNWERRTRKPVEIIIRKFGNTKNFKNDDSKNMMKSHFRWIRKAIYLTIWANGNECRLARKKKLEKFMKKLLMSKKRSIGYYKINKLLKKNYYTYIKSNLKLNEFKKVLMENSPGPSIIDSCWCLD